MNYSYYIYFFKGLIILELMHIDLNIRIQIRDGKKIP